MNILVYSANITRIERLSKLLNQTHFTINAFQNRKSAINCVCKENLKLCVIDGSEDGIEFLTALKLIDDHLPIIFIYEERNDELKYKAFELGVDDCVTPTISERELCLRVTTILKRSRIEQVLDYVDYPISIGSSTVDFDKRHFNFKDKQIQMSRKENDLLKLLYLSKGKVISRENILKEVWKTSDYCASKSMDVYLSKLRKILKHEEMIELKNIHGTGYVLFVN